MSFNFQSFSKELHTLYPEYPFVSRYFTIGEHRLHYIDEGKGPVVMMVHGNPTWSYYYRNLITLLSGDHRVIAVDNIGCGFSDKPQDYPYRLRDHIENLTALIQQLDIKSCSLIVHDWGGAIGMGYAGRYPERIEKIVVLNTAAFWSSRIPLRIRICRWPVFGALLVRGCNGFAWPACSMAVTRPLKKEIAEAYLAPYDSWKNRVAVYGFVRDIPLSTSHPSYETLVQVEMSLARLSEGNHPMLILWGGKDFCFNRTFYNEWSKRFPAAEKHFFENGGHYVLEDCLETIRPILQRFFRIGNGLENRSAEL
jgi:cis-3-alkyl-4-acyloxetan-2-one decarboxylase